MVQEVRSPQRSRKTRALTVRTHVLTRLSRKAVVGAVRTGCQDAREAAVVAVAAGPPPEPVVEPGRLDKDSRDLRLSLRVAQAAVVGRVAQEQARQTIWVELVVLDCLAR